MNTKNRHYCGKCKRRPLERNMEKTGGYTKNGRLEWVCKTHRQGRQIDIEDAIAEETTVIYEEDFTYPNINKLQ